MNGGEGEELAQVAAVGVERQRRHAALAGKVLEPGLGQASEFGVGVRKRRRVLRGGAGGGCGVAKHGTSHRPARPNNPLADEDARTSPRQRWLC